MRSAVASPVKISSSKNREGEHRAAAVDCTVTTVQSRARPLGRGRRILSVASRRLLALLRLGGLVGRRERGACCLRDAHLTGALLQEGLLGWRRDRHRSKGHPALAPRLALKPGRGRADGERELAGGGGQHPATAPVHLKVAVAPHFFTYFLNSFCARRAQVEEEEAVRAVQRAGRRLRAWRPTGGRAPHADGGPPCMYTCAKVTRWKGTISCVTCRGRRGGRRGGSH